MCYQVRAPHILYVVSRWRQVFSYALQVNSSQLPLGLPHSCVSTNKTRVLMICENLHMTMIIDGADRSMTAQSVGEWLKLWQLVSNSHWGLWGPLSILSSARSNGHQVPHRGSEKHDFWLGKRKCTARV